MKFLCKMFIKGIVILIYLALLTIIMPLGLVSTILEHILNVLITIAEDFEDRWSDL